MIKKMILFFAFAVFCLFCALAGFFFGRQSNVEHVNTAKPSVHTQPETSIKNQMSIPVLGCAIKYGECECYGRNTDDFSFSGDGKMTFDLSVCDDYIKHSGGSRYITIVDDVSEESEELREIRKEFRSSIDKKLEEITRKK